MSLKRVLFSEAWLVSSSLVTGIVETQCDIVTLTSDWAAGRGGCHDQSLPRRSWHHHLPSFATWRGQSLATRRARGWLAYTASASVPLVNIRPATARHPLPYPDGVYVGTKTIFFLAPRMSFSGSNSAPEVEIVGSLRKLYLRLYDRWACHELNFQLFKRDCDFFEWVVKPFIQTLDNYLLGMSLGTYVSSLQRFNQLNVAKQCLLSRPFDSELFEQSFRIVLAGGSLDSNKSQRLLQVAQVSTLRNDGIGGFEGALVVGSSAQYIGSGVVRGVEYVGGGVVGKICR
ncbi:hypothetical protein BC938DRAFT_480791 [Jimgerdemannia flammicorona]|uniref:Uncharacterized protein n=1 Tax=Jimgerdemannia flammicorona TaxID=994334 RepID=A0A433QHP3_9FUNG|nr:hypothetical protein BC938DRAFT_480791 [Jimgerdemannia flammicorona]